MTKSRLAIAAVLALTLAMVSIAYAGIAPGSTVPSEPPMMMENVDGTKVALHSLFKDRPGILVFFNTNCNSCLQEIKWLYAEHPDANIHLVSIDIGGKAMIERWQKVYLKQMEGAKVYLDPDFAIAGQFGVTFTPASVLFEKGAVLKQVVSGYNPGDHSTLESVLD